MKVSAIKVLGKLRVDPANTLAFQCNADNLPYCEREYRYAKGRKHRADLAWPQQRLLVEVQGGIYSRQAHGSITGILKDNERLNLATLNGWRLLRVTPDDIESGEAVVLIEKVLREKAGRLR